MEEPSFREIRNGALGWADQVGEKILEDGLNYAKERDNLENIHKFLPEYFAVKTAEYSTEVERELKSRAENNTQFLGAEIIDYEVRNKARKAGIRGLESESEGEEINLEKIGMPERIIGWDSWLSDFYQGFSTVDIPQKGLVEHKMREYDPKEVLEEMTDKLSDLTVDENLAGELYMDQIYVVNEDWVDYIRGEKPPSYDEEVVEYLRDMGVGV